MWSEYARINTKKKVDRRSYTIMLPSSLIIPRDSSPVKYCLKMVNSWFIYKCILFSSAPQQHMSEKKYVTVSEPLQNFPIA